MGVERAERGEAASDNSLEWTRSKPTSSDYPYCAPFDSGVGPLLNN